MNQWIIESMSIGKTEWSDWGRNGWRVDPSLPVSIRDREGVRGEEGKERFMEGWMDWWIGRPSKFFVVNSLTCARNEILHGLFVFLAINNLLCLLFQRFRSAKDSSASYRYGLAKFEVFHFFSVNNSGASRTQGINWISAGR